MHFKDLGLWPPNFQTWRMLELKPTSSGFYLKFGSVFFPRVTYVSAYFLNGNTKFCLDLLLYKNTNIFLQKSLWQGKFSGVVTASIQTIIAVLIGDMSTECLFSKWGAWVSLRCLLFVLKMAFQKPFLSFKCAISVTERKNANVELCAC